MTLNSEWISIEDIKTRLDNCHQTHAMCRVGGNVGPHSSKLLVIDTESECLVTASGDDPYLALSYVWGRTETLSLTRANVSSLQSQGSLRERRAEIPQTIRDAMCLTTRLGFRHLWVDTLCIVQDDEKNKMQLIHRMAAIYANAAVTVVAADGTDAAYGLKGLQGGSCRTTAPQDILEFSPGKRFAVRPPALALQALKKYFSRGWTFQEYHLSKRLLVFVDNKVVWKCQTHEWSEVYLEPDADFQVLPPSLSIDQLQWPDLSSYKGFVIQYNTRELSYESDVLNAFSGVLEAINMHFPSGFVHGLPEFYFDLALLWQPATPLRRRSSGNLTYAPPSWSWIGWHGSLDLDFWSPLLLMDPRVQQDEDLVVAPIVQWSKSTQTHGEKFRIDNSYFEYAKFRVPTYNEVQNNPSIMSKYADFLNSGLQSHGWTHGQWELRLGQQASPDTGEPLNPPWILTGPGYQHESLEPPFFCPVPIRSGPLTLQDPQLRYLHFRTTRTYFHMRQTYQSRSYIPPSCEVVHLTDDLGFVVGILRLHSAEVNTEDMQSCELVAISKGSANLSNLGSTTRLDETHDISCLEQIAMLRRNPTRPSFPMTCISIVEDPKKLCQDLRDAIGIYEFYNVLWIEWKDGVAYRKALGRVFKDVWESKKQEVIDVVLN